MVITRKPHRIGRRRMALLAMLAPWVATACLDEGLTGPQIEDAPIAAAEMGSTVVISGLQVASGYSYVAVSGGLANGAQAYIDRPWTYASFPAALAGQSYIRTRHDDRAVSAVSQFLTFRIDREAEVYVAYDAATPPGWLTYRGFVPTGQTLVIDKAGVPKTFHLFSRTYPAGEVVLGSNVGAVATSLGMYTVVVRAAGTVNVTPSFDAIVTGVRPRGFGRGTYTLAQPASGRRNYFVSTTGSDANTGTSSAPFRTINKAAQVARAGDVVTIRSGTYRETVRVKNAGTSSAPIVFQAAVRGEVVLTGGNHNFQPGNWTGGVKQSGAVWVTLRGLIFRDYARTQDGDGTDPAAHNRAAVGAIRGWRIEDCLFDRAGYSGLDIRGDSVVVIRSTFQYHHTLAMAAVGQDGLPALRGIEVKDVVLRGNNTRSDPLDAKLATKVVKFWITRGSTVDNIESYENQGPGWWFDTDNEDYVVRNSYIHHNRGGSGRGIFLEKNLGGGTIENNVFADNEVSGVTVRNSAGVRVDGNLFVRNAKAIMLVSHDVQSTWPLKDVTITANSFKVWTDTPAIHPAGNQIHGLTAAGMNIAVDRNVYDPGSSTELTYWDYTGWIRSISGMRSELGWEANGRIADIVSPL